MSETNLPVVSGFGFAQCLAASSEAAVRSDRRQGGDDRGWAARGVSGMLSRQKSLLLPTRLVAVPTERLGLHNQCTVRTCIVNTLDGLVVEQKNGFTRNQNSRVRLCSTPAASPYTIGEAKVLHCGWQLRRHGGLLRRRPAAVLSRLAGRQARHATA